MSDQDDIIACAAFILMKNAVSNKKETKAEMVAKSDVKEIPRK